MVVDRADTEHYFPFVVSLGGPWGGFDDSRRNQQLLYLKTQLGDSKLWRKFRTAAVFDQLVVWSYFEVAFVDDYICYHRFSRFDSSVQI